MFSDSPERPALLAFIRCQSPLPSCCWPPVTLVPREVAVADGRLVMVKGEWLLPRAHTQFTEKLLLPGMRAAPFLPGHCSLGPFQVSSPVMFSLNRANPISGTFVLPLAS